MHDGASPATIELLTWISTGPRAYSEAMEVWGSTCPRHSVWEDAVIAGLVRVVRRGGAQSRAAVALTEAGRNVLDAGTRYAER